MKEKLPFVAQLEAANTKVQDIAARAIEGASRAKALEAVNKIALEQANDLLRSIQISAVYSMLL